MIRGHHAIRVRILDPIPVDRVVDRPVEALTGDVRDLFARELGEPQAAPAAPAVAAPA